ncbi:MAG: type II toxin-antitoxin system Phd/YefM family antitoxin [Candidatus Tisiphia sp.]
MKVINAKEAQNNFGNLMNSAIKAPVVINKYGEPFSVLMSYEAYED